MISWDEHGGWAYWRGLWVGYVRTYANGGKWEGVALVREMGRRNLGAFDTKALAREAVEKAVRAAVDDGRGSHG